MKMCFEYVLLSIVAFQPAWWGRLPEHPAQEFAHAGQASNPGRSQARAKKELEEGSAGSGEVLRDPRNSTPERSAAIEGRGGQTGAVTVGGACCARRFDPPVARGSMRTDHGGQAMP
jgi:hypothetical protein